MALKKCVKEHKLFVAELERCRRLEKEGEQVLSSLANVAQRLPLLTAATVASSIQDAANPATDGNVMGVLAFCVDTQALLLQKHFAALEKSMTFLREIVKEFPDVLRRMRGFVNAYVELLDCFTLDDASSSSSGTQMLHSQLEWMENVLVMYERELRRKRLLVANVEYHDAARITRMHAHWSARSVHSSVDYAYVQAALEPPPAVSVRSEASEAAATNSSSAASQMKKKKKRR